MKAITESISGDEGRYIEGYDCDGSSPESLDWLVCNLQDAIRSRNLAAITNRMADPFMLGYWQSEKTYQTPDYVISIMQTKFLPENTSGITFTNDRNKFPNLYGASPEEMLGLDVNIVEVIFSGGWGEGKDQGVLLFLAMDESGNYHWAGMIVGFSYTP
jgi:hypothetical protein